MNETFPWEDLLDSIQDGKIVPVVGNELLEANYQGRRVSLQRVLAERLAERETLDVQWTRHFELNDAVCAYLGNPNARLVGLYDRIAGFLRSRVGLGPLWLSDEQRGSREKGEARK